MTKYDELFDMTAPDDSVFAGKGSVNSLAEPANVVGAPVERHP